MRWAGAAWATSHLRPSRHVSFLSAMVGPAEGPRNANQDMTNPFTSVGENFGRLIGRDPRIPVARRSLRSVESPIGQGSRGMPGWVAPRVETI